MNHDQVVKAIEEGKIIAHHFRPLCGDLTEYFLISRIRKAVKLIPVIDEKNITGTHKQIRKGLMKIDEVPPRWREAVRRALEE